MSGMLIVNHKSKAGSQDNERMLVNIISRDYELFDPLKTKALPYPGIRSEVYDLCMLLLWALSLETSAQNFAKEAVNKLFDLRHL